MSDLSSRLSNLSSQQLDLLARRLRLGASATGIARIPRRPPGLSDLPLSFPQERLWFLEQLQPGMSVYGIPVYHRIASPLDMEVLRRCLEEIARRHEALRTVFETVEGRPVQIVRPPGPVVLTVHDLRGETATSRSERLAQLIGSELCRPFEFRREPAFRALVCRLSDVEEVLLLHLHHIVSDGWSLTILNRELAALYEAFSQGRSSPLPELPIQYADYAIWQRGWLCGDVLEGLLDYWRRQLSSAPQLLSFPIAKARPPAQTFRGRVHAFTVSTALTIELRSFAQREGATPFMVLLAAFNLLLARYTAEEDILVGTPVANRTRAELEGLIGLLVNTLVLRTDLSGDPTFRELVGRVRDVTLGALAHQELPFERLVEELHPRRSLSHNPIFQVSFGLQTVPSPTPLITGAESSRNAEPEVGNGTSKFDLSLVLSETPDGLAGVFEYASDLFEAERVRKMADHYIALLGHCLNAPDRHILSVPLESENIPVNAPLAATGRSAARGGALLPELVEEHARRAPDAVAISFDGVDTLTYGTLNQRTALLTRKLVGLGVGLDSRVGLLLDRSAELPITILAVLRAGAAFVPLDPQYPASRLQFMLDDARCEVVLTAGVVDDLPAAKGLVVTSIERLLGDDTVPERPEPDAIPDEALAYIIYTSGSTGRPKGVMIPRRGLASLLSAQRQVFSLGPTDRVLQFSSPSFDACIFETGLALGAGATLCMAARAALLPGPALLTLLERQRISVATLPPTAAAALPPGDLPNLRLLIMAAEPVSAELVTRFVGVRRVFNAYGPTEATVWTTLAECRVDGGPPPIGRPIPGATVLLLDASGGMVPPGVPGEIYIGGPVVGRGYWGRPDLTAERFVPDPRGGSGRLYRTGDLAIRSEDGTLQFLRRLDDQVKLRGFRIELGEVEAALLSHPRVGAACATVREDDPGDRRLAVYVCPRTKGDTALLADDVRRSLRERLPPFMMPSAVVVMETLPTSPSGKIDRRSLPAPGAGAALHEPRTGQPPRSDIERTIARVFGQVLRMDGVTLNDDFFLLGGHSLLATQVIARLQEVLGVEVPIRYLFEAPVLEQFCSLVEALRNTSSGVKSPSVSIPRLPRRAQSRPAALDKLNVNGNRPANTET